MASVRINKSEQDEKQYLKEIKEKLQETIDNTDKAVADFAKEVQESKDYLWEHRSGMDHVEKVSVRQSITQSALTGEGALAKKKRLAKLMRSPYFGRIDFVESGEMSALYIGVHSYVDQTQNKNIIYDWRAPVSGMFYDFELGHAHYQAPQGTIEGEITLKRQYRIRNGKMEFMLESSLNIHDDVLQKELSQNSSEKMKNIVATIQRDQNAIIRNEESRNLIIQGVAGSGKTSIALHRIAFLLYRFKEQLTSEDILIISPNKVFADYISNVLPELGEEKISETSMEELADELLEKKYKFKTFFDQVAELLEKNNEKLKERIRFKSGGALVSKLDEFYVYIENEYFTPVDFMVKRNPIPASYILEKYKSYHRLPVLKRIPEMVRSIINDLSFFNRYEATTADRNLIKKTIEKMFKTTNLRTLYKEFYQWLGKPELLKLAKGSVYEFADVYPLIYLKIKLEGSKSYTKVKHLVIDEMQDYTPLQYTVLSKLFHCNKTILGDCNQTVNPYSASNAGIISNVFVNADKVEMNKSYRSTYEITHFANKIIANPKLDAVERHGNEPGVHHCKSEDEESSIIGGLINTFVDSEHQSMCIICKTQQLADNLFNILNKDHKDVVLLNSQSVSFANGVIIATPHMAKGLEFDRVVVPFCNSKQYRSDLDKQMLYIACTRAMHDLHIVYSGKVTPLLN